MNHRLATALAAFALASCDAPANRGAATDQSIASNAENIGLADTQTGKGVDRSNRGKEGPDAAFLDPSGEQATIGDFAGKPVLVNLWASWCAPCVKELPTLGQLAQSNRAITVVAVSQDNAPEASVDAFLKQHKLGDFAAYRDPKMALGGALGVQIMPTSILFDAQGHEIWRYVGDLDWTGPEAAKLLAEASSAAG